MAEPTPNRKVKPSTQTGVGGGSEEPSEPVAGSERQPLSPVRSYLATRARGLLRAAKGTGPPPTRRLPPSGL